MPLIRFLCLLMVAACVTWFAVATHAQQEAPLFPAPSVGDAASQGAAPGLWQKAGAFVVKAERDFSRELNSHMAAIRRGEGSAALLGGILAAFLYGVFHTLAVGHGKTVVVGYFLGNAARPVHGLAMAGWIALSHVLGAVIVAFAAHWLLRQMTMSPIEQNHWVRMVSFGAIALIGAWMLVGEVRRLRGHAAGHARAHDHDHGHHHHGHSHDHAGKRRLLAVAAGFVPCTGAILILTFAFANGILLSGLLMVGGIAIGMAATLAGLGLVSMAAHRQVAARFGGGRTLRWLGVAGPALILCIGALLFLAEASVVAIAATN
jgi:ABC-type nickel/cobalt efflux system permease component RcnA